MKKYIVPMTTEVVKEVTHEELRAEIGKDQRNHNNSEAARQRWNAQECRSYSASKDFIPEYLKLVQAGVEEFKKKYGK